MTKVHCQARFGPMRRGRIGNAIILPGFALIILPHPLPLWQIMSAAVLSSFLCVQAFRTGLECAGEQITIRNLWRSHVIDPTAIVSVEWQPSGLLNNVSAFVLRTDSAQILASGVSKGKSPAEFFGLEPIAGEQSKATVRINELLSKCGASARLVDHAS